MRPVSDLISTQKVSEQCGAHNIGVSYCTIQNYWRGIPPKNPIIRQVAAICTLNELKAAKEDLEKHIEGWTILAKEAGSDRRMAEKLGQADEMIKEALATMLKKLDEQDEHNRPNESKTF